MEAKKTSKEPLVQLVGKHNQSLILSDQETKSFPRTKVEEAQLTTARKQWDQEMFEKQIEATILREKQIELMQKSIKSTEEPKAVMDDQSSQKPLSEPVRTDNIDSEHQTSSFQDALSASKKAIRHKVTPKGQRVISSNSEELIDKTDAGQSKSKEVDQIALTVMNNEVQDFGSVVVPQDLLDFQVKAVIQDALKRVSMNYELKHFDLTAYKKQESNQQLTQYFEYQANTAELLQVGCLHFVYQAMPALFGQGFTLDGGTNLDQVDWLAHIQAYDWQEGDLTQLVQCDYQAVNTNKAGIYPVVYTVSNKAQQTNQLVIWMKVRISKPVINAYDLTITATLTPNSQVLLAQATAKDILEGNLINQVEIDDSAVDYQHVGQYPITYYVQNSFGLETRITRQITIEAQIPELQVQPIQLKLTPDLKTVNWLDYSQAQDSIDGDITNLVQVDDRSVDLEAGGQYPISFKVTNRNGQTITKTTQVTVVIPNPVIEVTALELNQGVNLDQVNWLDHVKAFDENDGDLSHQVTVFYGEVQANKVGEYSVYYMVRNQYQKQTTKQVKVWVR